MKRMDGLNQLEVERIGSKASGGSKPAFPLEYEKIMGRARAGWLVNAILTGQRKGATIRIFEGKRSGCFARAQHKGMLAK